MTGHRRDTFKTTSTITMIWLVLCSLLLCQTDGQIISISWGQLDSMRNVPYLPHFWTSTGFSPINSHGSPEDLLSNDVLTNLALIGTLPHDSITHVRIHWLLDLVTARRMNATEVDFDYSRLDILIAWLNRYKLYPGFELMGNPSTMFHDLGDAMQQNWWRKLVASLTSRYIAQYGLHEVKKWRFETWNEPDLKMYNTLNFTRKSFIAYVSASMDGLHEASGVIKLGGPAGLFRTPRSKHPLCWAFLDFVGSKSPNTNLSFISFHRKGNGTSHLIMEETLQLVRLFKKRYPTLRNIPLVNDEADPLTGWWRAEDWRADVRYAAMMARVAIEHLNKLVRRHDFAVKFISNDNAFLSTSPNYFTQRTLLARFQMNDTDPKHSQFFLKPVYFTLALMSLLGDRELPLDIKQEDPRLAVLAAGSWQKDSSFSSSVLLVFNNETAADPSCKLHFNLTLPLSEWSVETLIEARYTVFLLDNYHANPAAVWREAGSPDFPDSNLRKNMRQVQEYRAITSEVFPESGNITVSLQLPSVALIQLCTRPTSSPGQVNDVHALHVSRGEVLLLWRDTHVNTRCLLRYDVEFRPIGHQHFHRINLNLNSILLHFQYQNKQCTEDSVRGDYRIRAVDLWNRPGVYSQTLHY